METIGQEMVDRGAAILAARGITEPSQDELASVYAELEGGTATEVPADRVVGGVLVELAEKALRERGIFSPDEEQLAAALVRAEAAVENVVGGDLMVAWASLSPAEQQACERLIAHGARVVGEELVA